jgi:hypothetical protein
MDITTLDLEKASDEGVEIPIYAPNGDATDLYVTVVGQDSAAYEQLAARHRRETQANLQRMLRNQAPDQDIGERQEIETCVACTIGWRGFERGTEPIPFSRKAAEEVFGKRGNKWLREQVLRAITDRTLFFRVSAKG